MGKRDFYLKGVDIQRFLRNFFFVFVFLGGTQSLVFAQASLNIDYTNPTDITICGNAVELEVDVRNITTGTVSGIKVQTDLPDGVNYVTGSVSGNGVTESNISNLNIPEFKLPDLKITESSKFTIRIEADCDLSTLVNKGGLASTKITASYSGGSVSLTTKPLSVREPTLNIQNITNQFFTVDLYDTFVRKITISNSGKGFARNFRFFQVNQNGMKILGTSGGSQTISNDTIYSVFDSTHFKQVGNKDGYFDLNETVVIYDTIAVVDCQRHRSDFVLSWGCNGKTCAISKASANLTVSTKAPKLVISPKAEVSPCLDAANAQTQLLTIVNKGNDTARKFELNIFQSYSGGYYKRILSEIITSTLSYKYGKSGKWTSVTPFSYEVVDTSGSFACLSSLPVGSVTLNLPYIVPGDTMFLEWKTKSCCVEECGQTYYTQRWRYLASYYDQCGTKIIDPEAWGSGGALQRFTMTSYTPSDVIDGEIAKFTFTVSNYNLIGISSRSRTDIQFILPPGFSHSLKPDDFQFINLNGGSWKPKSITQSGDTINARFQGAPTTNLRLTELTIKVKGKCSSSADHGTGKYYLDIYYRPDTTCSTGCKLLLYCGSGDVKLHCNPSCGGGMNFRSFVAERASLGLPDNDNDGLPDKSGSLDFDKIKTERVTYGDTLLTSFRGKIQNAGSTVTWRYGKARSVIPYGRYLKVAEAKVSIYRLGNRLYYCDIPYTESLSGTTKTLVFDFGIPALIAKSCPLFTGFTYQSGDSIKLDVKYVVDPNPGNFVREITSTNEFYLSKVASPSSSQKYQCDTFSGRFILSGSYFTNCCQNQWNTTSCNTLTVSNNFYLSIGNCCSNYAGGNFFPYEYRPFAKLSKVLVIPPPGFDHVYSDMYQYRTAGSAVTKVEYQDTTPLSNSPTSDTLAYEVSQFYKDSSSSANINVSDDGFTGVFRTRYRPNCKAVHGNSQMQYIFVFERKGVFGKGYDTIAGTNSYDYINYYKPEIRWYAQESTVNAYSDTAEWRLRISNISTSSDASNLWVGALGNGNVELLEAVDLATKNVIPLTNGYVKLGDLARQGTTDILVRALYKQCNEDSIQLQLGFDCQGYPDSLEAYPCKTEKLWLKYIPVNTRLDVEVSALPGKVNLCAPLRFNMKIINTGRSRVFGLYMDVALRAGMVVHDTGWLKFPGSSDSFMVLNPTYPKSGILRWNISSAHQNLVKTGLGGIDDKYSEVYFSFTLETNCDFASSSYLLFKPGGYLKCGDPVNSAFEVGDPIDIVGVTKPYFASLKYKMDPLDACNFGETARFAFLNLGPDTTKSNDRIQLILPPGMYVNPAVSKKISNAPDSLLSQVKDGNGTTVEWLIPSGVGLGDSVVFEINIALNTDELPCDETQIFAQSVVKQPALCVKDSSTCNINVITADDLLLDSIRKSIYQIEFAGGQAVPSNGTEEVNFNYHIRNVGTPKDSGRLTTIRIIYDKNGDGFYNGGTDQVLLIDTISAAIDANWIDRAISIKTTAEQSCKLLIYLDTTNCLCDPVIQSIPPIPLRNAGSDTTVCSGQTVTIGAGAIPGNTYSWTPSENVVDSDSAYSLFSAINYRAKDSVYQLVLLTDKGACKTMDTVEVTIHPEIITTYQDTIKLCRGDSVIIGSIVTGGTGFKKYQWSPAAGLSAPQSAKTFAKPCNDQMYRMVVTDGIGCVHYDSTFVDVKLSPTARFAFADTCQGSYFSFADSSTYPNTGFDSIRWSINGVDTFFQPTNFFPIDTFGAFDIRLFVMDSIGCYDDTLGTLNVFPNPRPDMIISDDCEGDTLLLADNSTIPTGTYTTKWVLPSGDTLSGSNVVTSFGSTGKKSIEQIVTSDKNCPVSLEGELTIHSKPVIILDDTFVCKGDSLYLDIMFNGDSLTFGEWQVNSDLYTGTRLAFSASDTGNHNLISRMETKYGCRDTASATLRVAPLPKTRFNWTKTCEGENTSFTNQSSIPSGTIDSILWIVEGQPNGGNDNLDYLFTGYGVYPSSLIAISNYGCTDTFTDDVVVNYVAKPRLTVTGNCENEVINIRHNELLPDSLLTVNWVIESIKYGPANQVSHDFSKPGSHDIEIRLETVSGCLFDSIHTITVDPKPSAAIIWDLPCEDDEVRFRDGSTTATGTITSRQWKLHDGTLYYTDSFNHVYGQDGSYNVELVVENSHGCSDTATSAVTTNPKVEPSLDASDVCELGEVAVSNTSKGLSRPISSMWVSMDNGDTIRDRENFNYMYGRGQAGTKTLTLYFETLPGCWYTANQVITVAPVPTAGFTADPEETDILNSTVNVTDGSVGATNFTYDLSDGAFYTSPDFSHRFTDSGTYIIRQIAMNDVGCADTFEMDVRINFIYTFFVPNAVTPNNDGINDVFRPKGYGIISYRMIIFNRWGEILFLSEDGTEAWDPAEVMPGVYFYQLNVMDYQGNAHAYTGSIHVIR